jgi:hypothetical protein
MVSVMISPPSSAIWTGIRGVSVPMGQKAASYVVVAAAVALQAVTTLLDIVLQTVVLMYPSITPVPQRISKSVTVTVLQLDVDEGDAVLGPDADAECGVDSSERESAAAVRPPRRAARLVRALAPVVPATMPPTVVSRDLRATAASAAASQKMRQSPAAVPNPRPKASAPK